MEELYDAYCIQRRLRDGASKMVAAFNSTTGSREARESLSEANKGYRECTEVSCRQNRHLSAAISKDSVQSRLKEPVNSVSLSLFSNDRSVTTFSASGSDPAFRFTVCAVSLSAAHVLTGERVRKPHGRISRQDER